MDESLFPRGKPTAHPTSTFKRKPKVEKSGDSLFTETRKSSYADDSGKAIKRKRKARMEGPLKEHDKNDVKELLENQEETKVDFFHPKRAQEGILLLGCIKEIHELELVISLPHCNSGYVQANQISETYTSNIRQHLAGELDELAPLQLMFHVGDIVVCSVLNPNNSTALQLTLYPSVVNKYLSAGDFYVGQMITACVKSEEDHGFSIDIGKSNIKAFLPEKEVGGQTLPVGTVIRAAITTVRGEGSILLLSLDEKKVGKFTTKQGADLSIDSLLPGTTGLFKSEQKGKAGIVGKFFGYKASICILDCDSEDLKLGDKSGKIESRKRKKSKKHMEPNENSEPGGTFFDKLMADDSIKACVLYVNPLTKHVSVGASPTLLNVRQRIMAIEHNVSCYPCGEKCDVTVVRYVKGLGAVLKLENGTPAFCPTKQISDKKFENISEVLADRKSFPARVLQSVTLDGPIVVTLKKSIVESEFHSYDKTKPGLKINCTIQSIEENGLVVALGEKSYSPLKGFVPRIHMADVTLKHPEKMFSKGDIIECRVLSVSRSTRSIKLTHKRTLLNSKLPIITSYDQLEPDLLVHGYIASIQKYGIFINFYSDVYGMIPKSQLSNRGLQELEDLDKTYFVGQVMKCRVLNCDPANARARLSCILKPGASSGTAQRNARQSGHDVVSVEVVQKSADGLNVLICNDEKSKTSREKAFIPTMHLSDFPSLASFLHQNAVPGLLLPNCMIVNKRKGLQQVTRKKSVINFHLEDSDERDVSFSDLKEGLIYPGFILSIVPYGVFVELPAGLVGLCPKSKMADKYLLTADGYYQENQSVIAKVTEIDSDKKRFIVSLQESDCPKLSQSDVMLAYSTEFKETLKLLNMSWPDGVGIGKKVEVKYQGLENGKLVCTNATFPQEFTTVLVDDEGNAGDKKLTATILYVDLKEKRIILSSSIKIAKGPKPGKSMKATLIYTNEDAAVVMTDAPKVPAWSIARSHPNQSLYPEYVSWKLDDIIDVVMAKPVDHNSFVSIGSSKKPQIMSKRVRQESESSESSMAAEIDFGNLEVGQEVEGVIKSIRNNGLLVQLSEPEVTGGYRIKPITGRLHISELDNDPKDGVFRMKTFHCWSKIKCKVIGFRDVKTQHFLAITKKNSVRCVVDLSLRDEKVDLNFEDLEVGQEVIAFSTKYDSGKDALYVEVTPSIKGIIPQLLLSDDVSKSMKLIGKCKRPVVWRCFVHKVRDNTVVLAGKGALTDFNTQEDVLELRGSCVTNGRVAKIFGSNIVVNLPNGAVGRVHITDSSDDFAEDVFSKMKIGDLVRCGVLSCKNKKSVTLSMRKSCTTPGGGKEQILDKEIPDAKSLQAGMIIRGYVKNICKFGVFVMLSRNLTGRVDLSKSSKYYIHDPSIVEEIFKEGRLVTCKVVKVSEMEGKVDLSLLEDDTGVPEIIPEKLGLPLRHGKPHEEKKKEVGLLVDKIEGRKRKKRKQEKSGGNDEEVTKKRKRIDSDSGLDEDLTLSESPPGYLKINQDKADEEDDPGFSWDANMTGDSKTDSDSDSDEEEEVKEVSKRSKKEKEADLAYEEAELRRKEEMLLQDNVPETALDWDKLVLASPQSSLLWVSYMAFHLRSTEVEKARAVADRAIKTIDFREEKEKWNVWTALLNLENRFGTSESLNSALQRACQHNDPLKVNIHMVSTFERAGKFQDAEEICQKMVRKFRQNKTVWLLYITHLMQQGKREEAQEIFKRSLQSLEKKLHLEVISKYAQLEYKSGDQEHGRVLFENALSSYPKRADIWLIYIDMLVKGHKVEEAREVFERVTTLNLSTKNMRTFFKKFIEFETKFGNDESVADIKQKALEYIDSKTNYVED